MKTKISTEKTFEIGDQLYLNELNKRFDEKQSQSLFAKSICHVGTYVDNQTTRLLLSKNQIQALTALEKIDFNSPPSNKRIAGLLTYIREKSVTAISENEIADFCPQLDFQNNVIFLMILPENGVPLIHWRQIEADISEEINPIYPEIHYNKENDSGYITFSTKKIVKRLESEDDLLIFKVDNQGELVGIEILSVLELFQKSNLPIKEGIPKEMIPIFLIPHIYQYKRIVSTQTN
jgi:uncharacterized protein YuzE